MKVTNKKAAPASGASKLKIGIVVSQYYFNEITGPMLQGVNDILKTAGVLEKNITLVRVSGTWEIPYGCAALLKKKKVDALIPLGCVIKGETSHDHHLTATVTQALMNLSMDRKIPISLGVINANTLEQAIARSSGDTNKGKDAAMAALEMALLKI